MSTDLQPCDMHVEIKGGTFRQCKRRGIYIRTDRHGEHWVFCKQHFDMYTAAELG